ncbi:MAG: FkbM family methyltransferase [Clostridia bacterium]|nr:FkbM family methyltransferase [Clostridia bacterium]
MAKEIYGTKELWQTLYEEGKPIVLYGMGNGADKIISVLESKGMAFADVFASDDFVRGQFFHGKKVLRLSEAEEKYEDFNILVSFGSSLPSVMNKIKEIAARHTLYAPDVSVAGENLFDAEFFYNNEEKILAARELLADERSKEVYDELIRYKLDGKITHFDVTDREGGVFSNVLSGGYEVYCDLGAYTGDTVEEALSRFPEIEKIIAFEPSPKTFAKLQNNTANFSDKDITLVNACAWNENGTAVFTDGSGRNSTLAGSKEQSGKTLSGAKIKEIATARPDSYMDFSGKPLLIKFDVEGAEKEAIEGSQKAIRSNLTELCVSLYHRSEDIFSLPLLIHKLLPDHKLFIEKTPYIPAWEINLYACVRQNAKILGIRE